MNVIGYGKYNASSVVHQWRHHENRKGRFLQEINYKPFPFTSMYLPFTPHPSLPSSFLQWHSNALRSSVLAGIKVWPYKYPSKPASGIAQ